MSHLAREKLHAFEKAVFLKARTIKTAGALGTVGILSALLNDLGDEKIVHSSPGLSQIYAQVGTKVDNIASALHAGTSDVALRCYGELVTFLPAMHSKVAALVPLEMRGEPKDLADMMDIPERTLAILGLN